MSDLRLPQYESLLTQTQKVGVLYGDYMTRPVPRAEAEDIAVRTACAIASFIRMMLTTVKGFYSRPYLPQL